MDFPQLLQEEHLMRAIARRDHLTVRRAIKRGAEVNFLDSNGITPLTYAVEKGYPDIVQLLLESGADPDGRNRTQIKNRVEQLTPLLAAIHVLAIPNHVKNFTFEVPKENYFACMELLLKNKADPNKTGIVYVINNSLLYSIEEIEEFTPLFQAACYDQLECLQLLIDYGADVNLRDKSHLSPLTIAIVQDSRSCIEALLKQGASVTYIERERAGDKKSTLPFDICAARDQQQVGETNLVDLHSLIWEGSHQTLECVLKKGADINRAEINGDTPLHFAVKMGYLDCIRSLLEHKASLSIKNKEGLTPLHVAVLRGCEVTLSLLLQSGSKTDINAASSTGDTLLHVAVSNKKENCVKLLLEKGADPNAVNNRGDAPLHLAVNRRSKQCITMLLRKGADVFIQNGDNNTPLDLAAQWSIKHFVMLLPRDINKAGPQGVTAAHVAAAHRVEYLQQVLQQHANVNAETYYEKITPLHIAAAYGNETNVKLLLQNGASVNAKDIENETPMHYSAYWGHKACLDLMLETGARITNTLYATTPLHLAVMVGNEEITRTLISRCCPVDVRNDRNNTPLYESILAGTVNCMHLLVESGADIFATCQNGDTPLQLAARQGATYFYVLTEKLQPEQRILACHRAKMEVPSALKTSPQSEQTKLYRENPDTPTE